MRGNGARVFPSSASFSASEAVEAGHGSARPESPGKALREDVKDNVSALAFGVEEDTCLLPKFEPFGAWARGGSKP